MENASAAFLDAVRKSMTLIRSAIGVAVIDPALLTSAERAQYEGYLRREAANASILTMVREGVPIKQIAKRTGHSRKVVRNVARGLASDVFRTRTSSLEAYLPRLDAEWEAGCCNGHRAVAAAESCRFPRQPPRGWGMGDAAPAQ
jgi:transposase